MLKPHFLDLREHWPVHEHISIALPIPVLLYKQVIRLHNRTSGCATGQWLGIRAEHMHYCTYIYLIASLYTLVGGGLARAQCPVEPGEVPSQGELLC